MYAQILFTNGDVLNSDDYPEHVLRTDPDVIASGGFDVMMAAVEEMTKNISQLSWFCAEINGVSWDIDPKTIAAVRIVRDEPMGFAVRHTARMRRVSEEEVRAAL